MKLKISASLLSTAALIGLLSTNAVAGDIKFSGDDGEDAYHGSINSDGSINVHEADSQDARQVHISPSGTINVNENSSTGDVTKATIKGSTTNAPAGFVKGVTNSAVEAAGAGIGAAGSTVNALKAAGAGLSGAAAPQTGTVRTAIVGGEEVFIESQTTYAGTTIINSPVKLDNIGAYTFQGNLVVSSPLELNGTNTVNVANDLIIDAPVTINGTGSINVQGNVIVRNKLSMDGIGSLNAQGKVYVVKGLGSIGGEGIGSVHGAVETVTEVPGVTVTKTEVVQPPKAVVQKQVTTRTTVPAPAPRAVVPNDGGIHVHSEGPDGVNDVHIQ